MLIYYKKKWLLCSYTIILGIIVAMLSIFQGILLQIIVDTAVGNLELGFIKIILIVFFYGIFNFIINFYYKKNLYKVTTEGIAYIKNCMIESFLSEDSLEYNNLTEKLAIMEKDSTQVFEKYLVNFFILINQIILFLAATGYLFSINIFLTIVVLLSGIISIFLPQIFITKAQKVNENYLYTNKEYVQDIKELINGLTTIKIFDLEKRIKQRTQESNQRLEKSHKIQLWYQAFIECMSSSMGFFVLACNVVFAGFLSYKGYFTIGTVLAIMQIMNFVMYPLMQIPGIIIEMRSAVPAIDNIKKYINYNNEIEYASLLPDTFNSLKLEHVSLKPKEEREYIIEDVNIEFKSNKKYALVGASGSGKTTIIKLILGLYKNYQGNILINDKINLADISISEWRKNLTVMEQNIFIFDDTIKYNICFGTENQEININELFDLVGLKEFMAFRNNDMGYKLGENGEKISGGEKKRLAMARALYKQSKIILADEPTSGLDSTNAKLIEDVLNKCEKMVINVTHNLEKEVLKKYDKIICMQNGRVVGIGDYEMLISQNKYFQKLSEDYQYKQEQ